MLPPIFMKHTFTKRRKSLAAKMLADKIGYLKIKIPNLPTQTFHSHRIIRPKDQLFVVQKGQVEIWYTPQDILVTILEVGSVFGDLPLLGQTMLGCQAIAGSEVTLGVMNPSLVEGWIKSDPLNLFQRLGPHFARIEAEHYRVSFQTTDARFARLILDLAGTESTVEGFTQSQLAEQLGTYRETVANTTNILKQDKIIEVGRKKITILNRKALRELSEM
jgi:CRP-like cAMP-binding protein